jgi:CspA family cold shock protein
MPIGTIKRLVRSRGFGFLEDNQGNEYFFHRSAVQGTNFDALDEGQSVEFDVEREAGGRGPRAHNVRLAASQQ